jgi:hypothetical protein
MPSLTEICAVADFDWTSKADLTAAGVKIVWKLDQFRKTDEAAAA